MKAAPLVLLACAFFAIPVQAEECGYLPTGLERSIVEELNVLREDPPAYALHLEEIETAYQGKDRKIGEHTMLSTQEGLPAVDEAVRALKRTKPKQRLVTDFCLSKAAEDHVRDTGPLGLYGHKSSSGLPFSKRIRRHVKGYHRLGESISYGSATAREVVMQLLIDDGVPDRGHRHILLNPDFSAAGASCGPHAKLRIMCVLDFAGN